MAHILLALMPVFVLVGLGYALKRIAFPGGGFWPGLERMIFFVLFPALLISSLAEAEFDGIPVGPMSAALAGTLLLSSALMAALKPVLRLDAPQYGSAFMGATRINTYVGIAAADMLFGDAGLVVAAVAIAVWTPLVNLLSVLVLAGAMPLPDGARTRSGFVTGQVVKNPLILGTLAGIALNLTGVGLPDGFDQVIGALGSAALPLGLLTVGAGLETGPLRSTTWPLFGSCLFKLVIMPVIAIGLCRLLGIDGLTAQVTVLFAALPSATTAYILARQMHGDAPLMAGIITVSTLLAAITLPLILSLVDHTHLAASAMHGL